MMKEIAEQYINQKVIIHLAANWRVVGTLAAVQAETVEMRDDAAVPIFIKLSAIITIEPYRVAGASGHYI